MKAIYIYTQKLAATFIPGLAARAYSPQSQSRLFTGYGQVIILFLLLTGLSSCETLVNTIPESKLPKTESQLTLFSFISPNDTAIRVKVSQTYPLFSEYSVGPGTSMIISEGDTIYGNFDSFATATVVISDGVTSVTLPYDSQLQIYSIPAQRFRIKTGMTYTLTVTDGKRTIQASCTVPPDQVPINDYTLDTTLTTSFFGRDTTLRLSYTWNDIAGKENYYRVKAYELFEYSEVITDSITQQTKETRKLGRSYFGWSDALGRGVFQNDANMDGTLFTSPQGRKPLVDRQYLNSIAGSPVKPERGPVSRGLFLSLLNTDSNYYLFHRSVQAQDDNPFSEPALIYTNVKGGLGVFAAYNQSNRVVRP
ncbi:DUF4249 domain-containing protein [Telluribacter humicola]|uniref:DUF4249 domain-containing protein n=1 Tax=Telluribacter humicola TaxID=1720261 RepID=UPI001A960E83|nr:DUF4249 domain-containing protein [Telluribacter humicola]